mmetsp:Transcript_75792/g.210450  ORF Transcript_75792/g.210450 Transcript_75792/m.210450 type:complete len:211 (+) Transcript_75792:548-1180(+)
MPLSHRICLEEEGPIPINEGRRRSRSGDRLPLVCPERRDLEELVSRTPLRVLPAAALVPNLLALLVRAAADIFDGFTILSCTSLALVKAMAVKHELVHPSHGVIRVNSCMLVLQEAPPNAAHEYVHRRWVLLLIQPGELVRRDVAGDRQGSNVSTFGEQVPTSEESGEHSEAEAPDQPNWEPIEAVAKTHPRVPFPEQFGNEPVGVVEPL